MAALDDHGARAALDEFARRRFHPRQILDLQAGKQRRFRDIRRDHGRALHQFLAEIFHSAGIEQIRPAGAGLHHRIEHHVRETAPRSRNSATATALRAIAQHADFHRGDLHVFGKRVELRAQRRGGSRVNGFHALRGLHGQRGDRGDAVAIVRGESFQVRADARAAGRIKARDGQNDRRRDDDGGCSTRSCPPRKQRTETAGCAKRAQRAGKPNCTRVDRAQRKIIFREMYAA